MRTLKQKFLLAVFVGLVFAGFALANHVLAACPYTGTPVQCADNQALARGAKCQRVCELQEKLKAEQFYWGAIDGEYGPETFSAVESYQAANGLNADGIAGTDTLSKLGLQVPIPAVSSNTNPIPTSPSSVQNQQNNTPEPCPPQFTRVGPTCVPVSSGGGLAGTKTLSELVTAVIKYLLYLSGIIAIIFIILGGFWYMTAGGNDEQAEKGQKALTNAVIGLVLVILAYVIVNVVVNTLTSGTPGNSTTNTSGNTGVPSNVQYDPNNRRTVDQ